LLCISNALIPQAYMSWNFPFYISGSYKFVMLFFMMKGIWSWREKQHSMW